MGLNWTDLAHGSRQQKCFVRDKTKTIKYGLILPIARLSIGEEISSSVSDSGMVTHFIWLRSIWSTKRVCWLIGWFGWKACWGFVLNNPGCSRNRIVNAGPVDATLGGGITLLAWLDRMANSNIVLVTEKSKQKQTVRGKSFDLVGRLGRFDQLRGCHDD